LAGAGRQKAGLGRNSENPGSAARRIFVGGRLSRATALGHGRGRGVSSQTRSKGETSVTAASPRGRGYCDAGGQGGARPVPAGDPSPMAAVGFHFGGAPARYARIHRIPFSGPFWELWSIPSLPGKVWTRPNQLRHSAQRGSTAAAETTRLRVSLAWALLEFARNGKSKNPGTGCGATPKLTRRGKSFCFSRNRVKAPFAKNIPFSLPPKQSLIRTVSFGKRGGSARFVHEKHAAGLRWGPRGPASGREHSEADRMMLKKALRAKVVVV